MPITQRYGIIHNFELTSISVTFCSWDPIHLEFYLAKILASQYCAGVWIVQRYRIQTIGDVGIVPYKYYDFPPVLVASGFQVDDVVWSTSCRHDESCRRDVNIPEETFTLCSFFRIVVNLSGEDIVENVVLRVSNQYWTGSTHWFRLSRKTQNLLRLGKRKHKIVNWKGSKYSTVLVATLHFNEFSAVRLIVRAQLWNVVVLETVVASDIVPPSVKDALTRSECQHSYALLWKMYTGHSTRRYIPIIPVPVL